MPCPGCQVKWGERPPILGQLWQAEILIYQELDYVPIASLNSIVDQLEACIQTDL